MNIPKVSQIPLQQPMYVNGVMHQSWINYFESLTKTTNESTYVKVVEIAQQVSELPTSIQQMQHSFDILELQNMFFLDSVPIQKMHEMPPIQAVFLQSNSVLDAVVLPNSEIIHD